MLKSPRLSYLLAVATAWLPLYVLVWIAVTVIVGLKESQGEEIMSLFFVLLGVHLFTMVLTLGLIALYIVDVLRNPDLANNQDMRIIWTVLFILLNMFAMPVYWWIYLRPGSGPFERRKVPQPVGV